MERLIVLEVNEIPKQVIDWWTQREPRSAIAALIGTGTLAETVLEEELPRDLYPSQSWASVGMGVPYSRHGVFWYGDPKPVEYPFYWQAAADAGRSVGLMGVLHTSPRSERAAGPNYRFVMPDLFGEDADTLPASLAGIQELNLELTRQSARVASVRLRPSDLVRGATFIREGVSFSTIRAVAHLAAKVASGTWNKERLRVGQSLLLADVFVKQVEKYDPDVSVFFANHVAAFMHRYWAASFPQDWEDGSGYTADWVERHADELPFAMRGLDSIVGQVTALAERTGRHLMLVSSMGMKADTTLDAGREFQAVVRRPDQFLSAAGLAPGQEVRSAMVPQLTVVATSENDATHIQTRLASFLGDGLNDVMVAPEGDRRVLTFSYAPPSRENEVFVGGAWVDPATVGMSVDAIEDHRSGRHSNRGVIVSNQRESWPAEMSAFDVAPLLLDRMSVPPLRHHRAFAGA